MRNRAQAVGQPRHAHHSWIFPACIACFVTADFSFSQTLSGFNKLSNPGFESGNLAPWVASGSAHVSTLEPRTGSYALAVNGGSVSQIAKTLIPNTTYFVKGWLKLNGGTVATIGVRKFGGPADYSDLAVQSSSTSYAQVSLPFTTGSFSTSAEVYIAGDGLLADDIELFMPSNLVQNGGFETGSLGPWTLYGSVGLTQATTNSGSFAVAVAASPTQSAAEQIISNLATDTAYTLRAYVKSDGPTAYLGVKDFGGTETWAVVSNSTWAERTVSFTTGSTSTCVPPEPSAPGRTCAKVYLYNPATIGSLAVYGDDFEVTRPLNLLTNHGFESGQKSPWVGTGTIDSQQYLSGRYGGRVAAGQNLEQIVSLMPNATYAVRAFARTDGGPVYLGVKDYGGPEVAVSTESTAFAHLALTFLTGPDISTAKIYLFKPSGATAYGDDFEVFVPVNRIVNSGFETGSLGPHCADPMGDECFLGPLWQQAGTGPPCKPDAPIGLTCLDDVNRYSGRYAGLINAQGSLSQVTAGLSPATTYTFSAYVKLGTPSEAAYLGVKDFGGAEVAVGTSSASWTRLSVSFTTGASNTSALVYLYKPSGSNPAYIDDAELWGPSDDVLAVGQWSPPMAWDSSPSTFCPPEPGKEARSPDPGIVPVHAHVLANGNVMTWNAYDQGTTNNCPASDSNEAAVRLWNPATPGSFSTLDPPNASPANNLFCSGHTMLSDGRLFIAGGHQSYYVGLPYASTFDPGLQTWQQLTPMTDQRWYPSAITLPNGEVLVVSGNTTGPDAFSTVPEVWSESGWRRLTGAEWQWQVLYPWLFGTPSGKVFNAGPDWRPFDIDPTGVGSWTYGGPAGSFGYRYNGSSVLYDRAKVLVIGGGPGSTPPGRVTDTVEAIDIAQPAASRSWQAPAPMAYPRKHVNSTLLPDGNVLVTGGMTRLDFTDPIDSDRDAVLPAETWNPQTGVWQQNGAMKIPRLYHSTAFLMPDGRLFSGGGGQGGDYLYRPNVEFYSPGYIFRGARPSVTYAPGVISYGNNFPVETTQARSIVKAIMIRLPSVTHSFNQNQGLFNPAVTVVDDTRIDLTAPPNSNDTPPGHYMLFLVNRNGVASLAHVLKVSQ